MAVTRIRDAQAIQSVDLTSEVANTLPVGNGGTGVANPTAGNLLVGNGSSAMTALAPGSTDTNVVQSIGGTFSVATLDTFMGQPFETHTLMRNTVLTASTNFSALDALEIPAAYSLEVPAASSLEILYYLGGAAGAPGQMPISNGTSFVSRLHTPADDHLELYHDFSTKVNGAVGNTADSGQTWLQVWTVVAATPSIANGRFVDPDVTTAGVSGNYLQTTLGASCVYLEAEWDYGVVGSTSLNDGICIAACAATLPTAGGNGVLTSPAPDTLCHVGFYLDHYEYGKFVSNVYTAIALVPYASTFATSTLQHAEIAIDKQNSVLYVRGPDGNVMGHHDATIGTVVGPFVFCENRMTVATTDLKSGFKNFAADSAPIRGIPGNGISKSMALLLAGQSQDVNRLKASNFILVDPTIQAKTALHDVSLLINGAGAQTYKYLAMAGTILNDSRVFSRTTELNLNTSSTETDVISKAAVWGQLVVGSTFRITLFGTVQTQATSGTLTFKAYLGATAATQTFQMPSQTGASGPFGFHLNIMLTIRSLGASGTMICNGWGEINFATRVPLTTTSASTTTVDTTGSGSTIPLVKATAQWATNSATNILKVETATIEQVV